MIYYNDNCDLFDCENLYYPQSSLISFDNYVCQEENESTLKEKENENIYNINQKKYDNLFNKVNEQMSTGEKTNKIPAEIDLKKEKEKESTQVLNKKRRRNPKENKEKKHNKYSDDNVRRKCKHIVLQTFMNFINDKIKELCGNIGKGILTKKLLIINQNQITNASIAFNKQFLNKTLGEIFSEDISSRYTNFRPDHNKYVISTLIDDKDETKKSYFQKLFNLKFIECLSHFRESSVIPELKGLIPFNELEGKTDMDEDYWEVLKYYIMNYETIISSKRERMKSLD